MRTFAVFIAVRATTAAPVERLLDPELPLASSTGLDRYGAEIPPNVDREGLAPHLLAHSP